MKKLSYLTIVLLTFSIWQSCSKKTSPSLTKTKTQKSLNYEIQYVPTDDGHYFDVTLNFQGADQGISKIYLPNSYGPAEKLYLGIEAFNASNVEKVLDIDEGKKMLHHQKGADLTITYQVKQVYPTPISDPRKSYHPVFQKDYFEAVGPAFFIYPAALTEVGMEVNIEWKNFPADWLIHNSYGTEQRQQKIFWKDSLGIEAMFVGGKFRKQTIEINEKPLHVVSRGDWSFTDKAFTDLLQKVVTQQRKFWNDYDFDYYTVIFVPYMENIQGGLSYQGSGLKNSFSLKATPNVELKDFEYLFSHEMMHEWIGIKIKTAEPEADRFWLSEGFTDYFTYINMRESGLFDEEGYIEKMNEIIEACYLSPVAEVPNSEIAANMFDDYMTYGIMAYRRGCVFAMYVDWKIRMDTDGQSSLKNVMQDFLRLSYKEGKEITDELFLSTANNYLKEDLRPAFTKHIVNGELIKIEDWMLGKNTKVVETSKGEYDLGFDFNASVEAKEIVGIKENTNAYEAGLRNGQPLGGYSLEHGNRNMEVEIMVLDGKERRTIKYFPVSRDSRMVPAFVME